MTAKEWRERFRPAPRSTVVYVPELEAKRIAEVIESAAIMEHEMTVEFGPDEPAATATDFDVAWANLRDALDALLREQGS